MIFHRAPARQPQFRPRINRGNKLGARVLSAFVRGENITAEKRGSINGSYLLGACESGLMQRYDASSYLDVTGQLGFSSASQPFTIGYYTKPDTLPSFPGMFRFSEQGTVFIGIRSTNASYLFACGNVTGTTIPRSLTVPSPVVGSAERTLVVVDEGLNATTFVVWINGAKYFSTATSGVGAQTPDNSYLGWDGADDKIGALLDEFVIFDGAFNDAMALEYFRNPYQFYAATPRRFFSASQVEAGTFLPWVMA